MGGSAGGNTGGKLGSSAGSNLRGRLEVVLRWPSEGTSVRGAFQWRVLCGEGSLHWGALGQSKCILRHVACVCTNIPAFVPQVLVYPKMCFELGCVGDTVYLGVWLCS